MYEKAFVIQKAGLAGELGMADVGWCSPSWQGCPEFFGESVLRMDACWPSAGFFYPGVCRRWALEVLQTGGGSHLLLNPAFAALLSPERARGSGLWEEEGLKLFIALKQRMHRAFHSPSAPQRLGELELLLLFKWLSSCSFSSCHLTARL